MKKLSVTTEERFLIESVKQRAIRDSGRIYKDAPTLRESYLGWESWRMADLAERLADELEAKP